MPPRSFSVYQPVRSHAFADFGLSGGFEGLRRRKSSSALAEPLADTIVDRCSQPPSFCSIKQIRSSCFADEEYSAPSTGDARLFLSSVKKRLAGKCARGEEDGDFAFASISQNELLSLGSQSAHEIATARRTACNNSSSLALLYASGNPHLLWTTGSNGQFLMCAPIDPARALANPLSSLNASAPALDSSSIPTAKCFTHQRICDVEVHITAVVILPQLDAFSSDSRNGSVSKCFCQVLMLCLLSLLSFHESFTRLSDDVQNFNFTTRIQRRR